MTMLRFLKNLALFFCTVIKSPELIFISSKTILFPLITSLIWADSKVYHVGKMLIGKLLGSAIFVFLNIYSNIRKRSASSKMNKMVLF